MSYLLFLRKATDNFIEKIESRKNMKQFKKKHKSQNFA
jgi:hypothetical protein